MCSCRQAIPHSCHRFRMPFLQQNTYGFNWQPYPLGWWQSSCDVMCEHSDVIGMTRGGAGAAGRRLPSRLTWLTLITAVGLSQQAALGHCLLGALASADIEGHLRLQTLFKMSVAWCQLWVRENDILDEWQYTGLVVRHTDPITYS